MYIKNEKPLIRASMFYFDNEYCSDYYPESILNILKKYGFDKPSKFYADRLTKNKFVNYNEHFEDYFVKSYTCKDVYEVDITNGDINKVTNFWEFNWSYTFYKNSRLKNDNIVFKPWNVISLSVSYEWLSVPENKGIFLPCFLDMISVIKPVYANIDDVDNRVELLKKAGYSCVNLDHIQQIYWGNYIDSEHYDIRNLNVEKLEEAQAFNICKINEGIFFSLTKDPLQCSVKETEKARRVIRNIVM